MQVTAEIFGPIRQLCYLSILLAAVSCGGSSSESGGTVMLTGNLANNLVSGSKLSPNYAVTANVDLIWALPTLGGNIDASIFAHKQEVAIAADGSFTLELSDSYDWVLLLLDSTQASKQDQIIGYVAINDDASPLLQIPLASASASSITLGEITLESGDEALTSSTLDDNASNFVLSLSELREIAKTDDLLRHIKNVYINYDEDTGTYLSLSPYFGWRDDNGNISIFNQFSDPADTVNNYNNGYSYYLRSNHPDLDFSNICDTIDLLSLHPPADVTQVGGGATWNDASPWINDDVGTLSGGGTTCGNADLYINNDGDALSFNYSGGVFWSIPIVAGYWQLKLNDTTLFEFDGQLGSPFEDDDIAKPLSYIPTVKAVVNAGLVESIEIKWLDSTTKCNTLL